MNFMVTSNYVPVHFNDEDLKSVSFVFDSSIVFRSNKLHVDKNFVNRASYNYRK